jgi:enterochelin esterase-like enzyme
VRATRSRSSGSPRSSRRTVSERSSPLVEEGEDGRFRVTVCYRDDDADDVWLIGGLAGADPADRRLRRSPDGWWERTYDVPRETRTAYWFTNVLVPSGAADLVPDPLNPRVHVYPRDPEVPDEEDVVASLVELPDAPARRWSVARDGVARGQTRMERLRSERLGNERRVYTYVPPSYDAARSFPLVVCFDGRAYVDDAYVPLPTVLDNLIADGAIPPVVAVLPDSLDSDTRSRELNCHEPFVAFLTDELLPWARERLSFTAEPALTVAAGSSLGGLAAAHCALRRPDVFGLVLSQSGAFHRGLPAEFARAERLPLRFSLDVGALETTPFERFAALYHANVHLHDVLIAKGYDVSFRAFPGGHDYFWWRETIAGGLISLLGTTRTHAA